jgi:aminoglycoside phosphotransferase (APT) family kinase protein
LLFRGERDHISDGLLKAVERASGISIDGAHFLSSGAMSRVWTLTSGSNRYVLRVSKPDSAESPSFESDYAIRRALTPSTNRVARPICTSADSDAQDHPDWALDAFVDGEPGVRGRLPIKVCRDLGELLAELHSLPAEGGYGLLENRRDRLAGVSPDSGGGFRTRLDAPWPFSDSPLDANPIATAAPELLPELRKMEPELRRLGAHETTRTVAHTDLHEGQLLIQDGRLAALLDFGDAVVGAPAWDIASFAFIHSWGQTRHLLEGYTGDESTRVRLLGQARIFAVLISLHHAGRSAILGEQHRMNAAVAYLHANLGMGSGSNLRTRR